MISSSDTRPAPLPGDTAPVTPAAAADPYIDTLIAAFGEDLVHLQIAREQDGYARGQERFEKSTKETMASGMAHLTPGGRTAVDIALLPIEQGIERWLSGGPLVSADVDAARTYLRGRKTAFDERTFLHRLDARTIATIVVESMVDGLGRGDTDSNVCDQQAIVSRIARRLWDAASEALFIEQHPDLLHYIERDGRRRGHSRLQRRIRKAKAFDKVLGAQWADAAPHHREMRALASNLLWSAVANTPNLFNLVPNEAANPLDKAVLLVAQSELLRLMEDRNARAALFHPIIPPFVVPPRPWSAPTGGAHIGVKRISRQLVRRGRKAQRALLEQATADGSLAAVYVALNAAQETAWRINAKVYETLTWFRQPLVSEQFWELLPGEGPLPLPPKPAPEMDAASRRKQINEIAKVHQNNRQEQHRRDIVNTIMATVESDLMRNRLPNGKLIGEDRFWLAYDLDHRGRMYPMQTALSPQGTKLARALLEFADGVPIVSDAGERWLMIHIANCWGQDKLSIADRLKWFDMEYQRGETNGEMLCRVGRAPRDKIGVWGSIGDRRKFEPWLALRAAIEWAEYKEAGRGYISHVPVCLDGSCNGLQHLSALVRDEGVGELVGLGPERAARDIYTLVAESTRATLQDRRDTSGDVLFAKDKTPHVGCIGDILGADLANRSFVKPAVMTIPYGATGRGVLEKLEQAIDKRIRDAALRARNGEPNPLVEHMPWALDIDLPKEEDEQREAERQVKRKRAIDRLECLKGNLSDIVWKEAHGHTQAESEVMEWLQRAAGVMTKAGLPIQWTAPTGFHCYQASYHRDDDRRIERKIAGVTRKLRHTIETDRLDGAAQRRAMPPGFIHSLDAAHMMMLVQAAAELGVSAFALVHDSFGTHAERAQTLSEEIQRAFERLHDTPWLVVLRWQLAAQLNAAGKGTLEECEAMPGELPACGELNVLEDGMSEEAFS